MNSPIKSIAPQDSWATVTLQPYEAGNVIVDISVTANLGGRLRGTQVQLTTTDGKTVMLKILQEGQPPEIPTVPSDEVTDQPALAPQR